MRHRMIATVLGAAVSVATLAGCTTTSQGQPQPRVTGTSETVPTESSTEPSPPSTSPSKGDLPSDGAPKVKNPLDTRRFQQNPCQVLTPAQLQELNVPPPGEQRKAPLGLACKWFNPESGGDVEIQWADENPRGLSGTYAARNRGRYAYFVELPEIEGFPAVASGLTDGRPTGGCIVTVGVTDQLIFQLGLQLSLQNIGQKDPCEVAAQVAGMMVQTMKAGG